MPTKRRWTTALCTETALIVAGGWGAGGVLSTVEVMNTENTENYKWSTAADLPEPMCMASGTVCGGCIYMLGGTNIRYIYSKSVYTCSLSALLQPHKSSSLEAYSEKMSASSVDRASVWSKVTDLPVRRSTCVSFHGRLLAMGGMMDSGKPTTAVYMYNSATNSWEIISHMTTGRCDCFAAVLPDNQLMVVGGRIDCFTETDIVSVEFASLYG